ncbi:pyridoxamine 5'-phosphate oxidase family protein [Methylocapsa sp. S129]|uniref:pyridoxamine 5'-phosphate oxidase family protein n=1 Tax=Methylocapsa sp. S129 TaxID=1641869 RepID=UPI00131C5BDA|nr:pyridoxamine 5'-phosphate oxidase family protein [Methylocapsa sp. S129]
MNEAATSYEPTDRTRVRRRAERGVYNREVVHKIIDEALLCHVGFVVDGQPRVIPTAIARIGEDVYIHGSPNNQMLTTLASGAPACLTITLVDSIVAGRSGFGCSMDYRSVVIFSSAEQVIDAGEKSRIIAAIVQDIIPSHVVRPPKEKELAATVILRFPLTEVSAKVRDVGVRDVEEDYELDSWAGVIPLRLSAQAVRDCPRLKPSVRTPSYAKDYKR